MPITSKLYHKFLYIWYSRVTPKDALTFSKSLESSEGPECAFDVVIDLVICEDLISPEVVAILRLAKKFSGTKRCVRLLTNPKIRSKMVEAGFDKVMNLAIYNDQQSFISEITGKSS